MAMELQRSLMKSFFDKYLKAKVKSLKELEKKYDGIELKGFSIKNNEPYESKRSLNKCV
jgi:hypothetical protein